MLTPAIALLIRWGLGERAARLVATIAAAIAALALLGGLWALWLHSHDNAVIDKHEAGIAAAVASATNAANDVANANDTQRQIDNARATILTEKAAADAQAAHPVEARLPAGAVSRAVADSLRHRTPASGASPGR